MGKCRRAATVPRLVNHVSTSTVRMQTCSSLASKSTNPSIHQSPVLKRDSFANAARARIQWLEGIIRDNLPDVDLTEGPQIDILSDSKQPAISLAFDPENAAHSSVCPGSQSTKT